MAAETKPYVTRHRLIHDGKKFAAGSTVHLTEPQAATLHAKKHIVHPVAAAKPLAVSEDTLGKYNAKELASYAASFDVAVAAGASKAEILAALKAAGAVAVVAPAEAAS